MLLIHDVYKAKSVMAINMSVIFYVVILVCHLKSASTISTFQAVLCPGDVLTSECATMGAELTVWRGTALQCDYGYYREIILLHGRFNGSHNYNITRTCNNRTIIARALGVVNNSYTSQLSVTVSPELNNTTVECLHDNGTRTRVIKTIQIIVLAIGK